MIAGIIVIIIGALLLLEQAGIVSGDFWGYVIGAAVLLFGIKILVKHKGGWCCCCGDKEKKAE